jgi:chromosomal replication initiator protein
VGDQLQLEDEEVSITLRRAWDRALRGLATRVNKPTFESHIRTLRPLSLAEEPRDDGRSGPAISTVTLGVPSAFTREWVEKRHSPVIRGLLEEILDRDIQLRFVIAPAPRSGAPSAHNLSLFDDEATPASPAQQSAGHPSPTTGKLAGDHEQDARPTDAEFAAPELLPPPVATRAGSRTEGSASATTTPQPPSRQPGTGRSGEAARGPMKAVATEARSGSAVRREGVGTSAAESPTLNSRYTFDSFVTGSSNRLAHAGARAVAQSPGQVYNPLFLYGPSGLGKTHLMHAIGNELQQVRGSESGRVAYVSGETFTSHFISSLREQRTEEFRRKWRSVDIWLVDDIQFIAGKESTKEEFFHTFNTLYQMGRQIVICADRSPRELRLMDDRLRSRFESGLIADIAPPDLETRLAILHRKAQGEGMRIPDDVLLYMARLVQSNIRTLEGALVKLVAYASVVNSPVTTELATSILERYFIIAGDGACDGRQGSASTTDKDAAAAAAGAPASRSGAGAQGRSQSYRYGDDRSAAALRAMTPELVQRVVARRFGLTPDALSGRKRTRDVVAARQVAMHLMRELTDLSLPGIGNVFGGRDHTTVIHACDRVKSQMPANDDLRQLVEDLAVQLRAQAGG